MWGVLVASRCIFVLITTLLDHRNTATTKNSTLKFKFDLRRSYTDRPLTVGTPSPRRVGHELCSDPQPSGFPFRGGREKKSVLLAFVLLYYYRAPGTLFTKSEQIHARNFLEETAEHAPLANLKPCVKRPPNTCLLKNL
jgi:hypothetical protein